jgi:uncharacterized membrane protein YhaH (DUF805 family)
LTFTESIQTCFRKYADFKGRASRSEYWWFFLFDSLVSIPAAALLGDVAFALFILALLFPTLAVSARRLHDTGRSGWWQLLWWCIPVIGLLVWIYWCVQDSEGPNKYG